MTTLAKKYGLSDNGLRKICKAMNIPLPRAGHWAKAAVGRASAPPKLPTAAERTAFQSNPPPKSEAPQPVIDEDSAWLMARLLEEQLPEKEIVVNPSPSKWHPEVAPLRSWLDTCVVNYQKALKGKEQFEKASAARRRAYAPDYSTMDIHNNEPVLGSTHRSIAMRVSTGTYERALTILNALAYAADLRGSPLYTESLLRLIRSGMPPNDAIAKWRGALGIDVRNAALKREVLQLSPEAKRALVTVAILGECSYAEVKQATGFSDQTLVDSFNELQSLFLLYAPEIAGQSRTGISNTTRDLVRSLGPELIPSFSAYEQLTQANRFKVKSRGGDVNIVGAAINQALALLAARNPEEALKTVDEVNKKFGGKNHDLLFMQARSLLACNPSRIEEARRSFKQAYAFGQRKALFFQLWFETESQAEHYEIAIEVASDALGAGSGYKSDWLINRAHSRIRSAAAQSKVNDVEHSRMQLVRAANDLVDARKVAPDLEWDNVWKELLYSTHDSLWSLDTREMLEMPSLINALDGQLHAIGRGDTRFDVFVRLPGVLDAMSRVLVGGRDSRSEKENNLMVQSTRLCLAAYKAAPQNLRSMRAFDLARKQIDSYAAEYGV